MSNPFIIYKLSSCLYLVTMVSSLEVFVLCFSVGVVAVVTSCVVCKYLVELSTSDCPLAKVWASPDISPSSTQSYALETTHQRYY